MHERYTKKEIAKIWSDENKLKLWLKTELAVIEARMNAGKVPKKAFDDIERILTMEKIDIEWWEKRDGEIHHDLNAFVDERMRFIPEEYHQYFHKKITSYDTEEPAFARIILESLDVVYEKAQDLGQTLGRLALKHRYTIMNGRTHGQEAEMQTFGKRVLAWYGDLEVDLEYLEDTVKELGYSKLSGAIGNYGSIDPEIEREVLKILGFEPFYGATQIIPREVYAPVAQALSQIVQTLNKIALAIRLGARSGRPIFHEPFAKKQKGSSAMPHKKNTIMTEQIGGMAIMARGYATMISECITTWEERAIEQSCVERVAWPDLFHVVVHSLERMTKVLDGLVVYPDNMLLEIVESRGCYASSEAKEFLKEEGVKFGLSHEDAYRIVQLSAFNAFDPNEVMKKIRNKIATSFTHARELLEDVRRTTFGTRTINSIQSIIWEGVLSPLPEQLDANEETVEHWNDILVEMFKDEDVKKRWDEIFTPEYLLKNEAILYREILGIE